MTIDEAIKKLEKYRRDRHSYPTDLNGQAMQLGIEALKTWKERLEWKPPLIPRHLPGETPGEPQSLIDPAFHLGKREGDR